ncbi:MAG: CPBP family intramembrane metalloprotease [Oscillospiraceae bacterium]|nr:CPBP family intramembrane metalloprotease [Oscillospiraceae bacterium]
MRFKMLAMQWLLVGVLFVLSVLAYYFFTARKHGHWVGLFPVDLSLDTWRWLLLGLSLPLLFFFGLYKLAPREYIYDENVKVVSMFYSARFLVPFLFVNALMEEIFFRGVLHLSLGIIPSALIFSSAHISYYKKPLLMFEVFTLGVFFSFLFERCGSLWVCAVSHAFYNFVVMMLIKTGKINY